ncbi:MAG: helix-turn-helix transcriptional regulator [Clostridiales bacterium]|nr:helix-turn-helix transcriptional regulator [Candidatus Crickella equi]
MTLGEKIKYYRNFRQLTQKQLGDMTEIHEVAIRKYELDKTVPRKEQLVKIADALKVPYNAFLDLKIENPSDVLALLFAIDDYIPVKINPPENDGDVYHIDFESDFINSTLREMCVYKESNYQNDEYYDNWKKVKLAYAFPPFNSGREVAQLNLNKKKSRYEK